MGKLTTHAQMSSWPPPPVPPPRRQPPENQWWWCQIWRSWRMSKHMWNWRCAFVDWFIYNNSINVYIQLTLFPCRYTGLEEEDSQIWKIVEVCGVHSPSTQYPDTPFHYDGNTNGHFIVINRVNVRLCPTSNTVNSLCNTVIKPLCDHVSSPITSFIENAQVSWGYSKRFIENVQLSWYSTCFIENVQMYWYIMNHECTSVLNKMSCLCF